MALAARASRRGLQLPCARQARHRGQCARAGVAGRAWISCRPAATPSTLPWPPDLRLPWCIPPAGNIGGGGFMLIRMADGKDAFSRLPRKSPGGRHARHVSRRARQRHSRAPARLDISRSACPVRSRAWSSPRKIWQAHAEASHGSGHQAGPRWLCADLGRG